MCAPKPRTQLGPEEEHPLLAQRRAVEYAMVVHAGTDIGGDRSVSPVSSVAVVSGGATVQRCVGGCLRVCT